MANCARCGRQLPALTFGKKICQWCVQHEAAQRGEDGPVQRVEPAPWMRRQSSSMVVTQAIFGLNVAVFVAMLLPGGQEIGALGANYGPATIGGEWWRLLTCVFIHGGLLHIAFNMWCLWDLGRLAESVYGHWTFAAVYLITGLAASLGSLFRNPGVLSVGASGAIFGIAGALVASFYLGEFSLPRRNHGDASKCSHVCRVQPLLRGNNCPYRQCCAHRWSACGAATRRAHRPGRSAKRRRRSAWWRPFSWNPFGLCRSGVVEASASCFEVAGFLVW